MSIKTLINGEQADCITVSDRGLQFGDGLFETIAVDQGKPLLWQAHMDRLVAGCEALGINFSDTDLLLTEAEGLLRQVDRAVMKVIITRGNSSRGYTCEPGTRANRIIYLHPWPQYPRDHYDQGVRLCLCNTPLSKQPLLAGIKHLNRLEQVLARNELGKDCEEGLMCNEQGQVIEGTMSNIFLVIGEKIITPDLKDCGISGIMRDQVMACAAKNGIDCELAKIPITMMPGADAVFLTNSLIGVWPVRKFGKHRYTASKIITTIQELTSYAFPKP